MTKTAFITGASSGIGWATAVALGQAGFRLVLTGRRRDRLEELARELGNVPTHLLTFDVRNRQAVEEAVQSLPAEFQDIDVLINNAGNAHGLAPIQDGDPQDWDDMMDGNVKGLLYVSKAVLPSMTRRNVGHIINIGSIAGHETYANGNVYCASKAAVAALTKGMRLDLLPHNIRVAEVNPGAVETEFSQVRFKGDNARAATVYQGFEPLKATDVAELIQFMVTRPAHVNIAEVLILPAAQAAATVIKKA
ncbi:SDR family NAD(P)-dependent oxidoreductase [Hymenobacter taeanensis]|uniref:SDR family NAD(P)-dependent oxidoreductase n=1 Tax=Hymenobacter taeanensis TaxID=2735321 RepID=A0A6M6BMU9_9BACT|nr:MULTISPECIES: SDR family NAD(P)-dependent oxidoreductase [Hymenobacter]QJX48405.1 SDR family NAD(P)-dependent oxidoreductase [Hymenobacter taeanensis]UOQ82100.1 SDR family NAD(P)-dependent oxidoreductase [Hymenobacter sp. 5414T-23]